nr:MAG TPA: hypothetical protein [Caudoviricetes sp.]
MIYEKSNYIVILYHHILHHPLDGINPLILPIHERLNLSNEGKQMRFIQNEERYFV